MTAARDTRGRRSPPPACVLCGGDAWEIAHEGLRDLTSGTTPDAFDLWRCAGCGVGRTWPVDDDTSLYYPDTYVAHRDHDSRDDVRWRLRFAAFAAGRALRGVPLVGALALSGLRRYGGETWFELSSYAPARRFSLLDVGCASGSFARNLRRLGIDARGVEPAASAAAAARAIGVPCQTGTIQSATYADESFDVVRFCHVLEHTRDPAADLSRAFTLTRPGGRVAIRVPAWDSLQARLYGRSWRALDIPRHLWHFTRPSLEVALDGAGFRDAVWRGTFQDFTTAAFLLDLLEEGYAHAAAMRAIGTQRAALAGLKASFAAAGDATEWFVVARRPDR